jgi:preprotein translocase subunit SecD
MKNVGRLTTSIVFVAILVAAAVAGLLTSVKPLLGLDLEGGLSVILKGPAGTDRGVMEKALDRIRDRVDALGVAEPDISLIGSNLIQVQLPGLGGQGKVVKKGDIFCVVSSSSKSLGCYKNIADAQAKAKAQSVQRVLEIIGTTARLEEREVLQTINPSDASYKTTPLTPRDPATGNFQSTGDVVAYGDQNSDGTFTDGVDPKYQLGKVEITGADFTKATAVFRTSTNGATQGSTGWEVDFTLNKSGAGKFSEATKRLVNKQLAIVLDGVVESAPVVQGQIPNGSGVITLGTGATTAAGEREAKNLAVVLNSGSLPVQLVREEVQTVSPLLGKESLREGLVAGLVGLIALMLYLAFYYRLLGLVTWVGMGIWGVLAIGLISLLGKTIGYALTLAGVAGIIVSLGITADSYIVFYERLKDDVRRHDGLPGSLERRHDGGPQGLAVADLVLQPFVEHDVGVGGDPQGHDDPGHARQCERVPDGLPQ